MTFICINEVHCSLSQSVLFIFPACFIPVEAGKVSPAEVALMSYQICLHFLGCLFNKAQRERKKWHTNMSYHKSKLGKMRPSN